MNFDNRTAHRLALAFATVCERVDGPNFADLIDDALVQGDLAAMHDVMWGAQSITWWAAQRSSPDHDLLGETMCEFRHLVGCLIDGYPVPGRSVSEICAGLRVLGSQNVFVQLVEVCGVADALDLADSFDELMGPHGFDAVPDNDD